MMKVRRLKTVHSIPMSELYEKVKGECNRMEGGITYCEDDKWKPHIWGQTKQWEGYKCFTRLCHIITHGYRNKKHHVHISWFGVREDTARGKGVGSRTYRILENYFRDQGVKTIDLVPLNKTAALFWERQGFTPKPLGIAMQKYLT